MARTPIYAAGGIVVRGGGRRRLLIAVVQRSKDDAWVLPRGKLKRNEDPVGGARREAVEETGHRVEVHEFLGAITYRARGRSKIVQFWRMQAYERPSRDVMKDIVAVEWLPLAAAVRRLSYPLEKLFLQFAGRRALKRRKRPAKKKTRRKAKAAVRRKRARRALKVRVRKPRARKPRATAQRSSARAAKIPTRMRRARPHRHKQRLAAPLRVAAVKHTMPTKGATPAQIAATPAAPLPPAPVQTAPVQMAPVHGAATARPTMLERVLGRLGR